MLSIGKLAAGQAQYYLDTVATGVEDYYTGGKEAPGVWVGASAARLGLDGQVDAEALHRVLSHADPMTGERLTRGHSVPKVVGFDATFCAPKSVSLLFALGDPETSNEVRNAHDTAVAAALDVFEDVARGRRGAGGKHLVDGDGFVAAGFRHRTSRAGDPHLHTHVVIANLVHAETDGRWSALDGRPVFGWCRTVGHLYEAQLRFELTRRLGVEWGPVTNGIADVDGIAKPVLRAFSTRRAEIDAHLEATGRTGARAAQQAAYFTRAAKNPGLDVSDLVGTWRHKAASLGLDDHALAATLHRVDDIGGPVPGTLDAEALYGRLASPEGLTAKRSTFGYRQVFEAVCDALPAGGRVEDVLALTDEFLASAHVVGLTEADGAVLHKRDGHLIPAGDAEMVWSTPEMITIEQRLLAGAARRRFDGAGVAHGDAVAVALAGRPTISAEQAAMVGRVCGSGAGVDVVVGCAGGGKTYALSAANDAWVASGFEVTGVCLAAKAARRLEEGSGIRSITLCGLLGRLEGRWELTARDIIVCDEAAMVGTRALARLLEHAETAGAKVVLIGDPAQLPAIDAGGGLAGLAQRFGAVGLAENRRQHHTWEIDALDRLRGGDPDPLDAYMQHNRVHVSAHDEIHDQVVAHWWTAREAGEEAIMVAPTLRDVDALNTRARGYLDRAGELHGGDVEIGGRGFAVGDRVLALRNDHRVGILNGTHATLTHIDPIRRLLVADDDAGVTLVVPFAYAEQHLTHGYATTIHKAQGATVERAFVLVDDTISREHLYSALSRGAARTDLHVADDHHRTEHAHANETVASALERLERIAERSAAKHLALDHPGTGLVPIGALIAERDQLRTELRDAPPDPSVLLQRTVDQIATVQAERQRATARGDDAQGALERLGPLGARLHRGQRIDLQRRRDRATADIAALDNRIGGLAEQANELARQRDLHRAWRHQNEPELDRLHHLDTTIAQHQQAQRLARRETPAVEHGLGLGL